MVDEKKKDSGKTFYKAQAATISIGEEETKAMDKGWGWTVALGVFLVVLGALAMIYPAMTSAGVVYFLGTLLIIGGVVQLIQAFTVKAWGGFFWHLALAVLYIAVGIFLFANVLGGLLTVTLILGFYFLISGVFKIILSIQSRHTSNWGWMMFGGIVALGLGVLVMASWPTSSLWFIGLLIGIDLIIVGFSLSMIAASAHSMAKEEV